ncbi:MAG: glycosyltransferase family 4 protein [Firmicutes bacterium]|nr:glycosyltransferase family 4 protein [Bacillota bacterium]
MKKHYKGKMMENKVKICALTTISQTMELFVVDSMRNLSENGYEITLVCDMDKEFVCKNSDYAKCIPLQMNRGASIGDLIKIPFKLVKIFREGNYDVVYYMSPNASFYASVAAKFVGIKHRIYSQTGLRYVSLTGIKRNIFKIIEKVTCRLSTTIRAVSPKNREYAISEGLCEENKISVVGIGGTIGVDLSLCDSFNIQEIRAELKNKYNIPKDAFVFGYVGRINADKGINELIKAFSEIEKKYNHTYLVLIGMMDRLNPISRENMDIANKNPHIVLTGDISVEMVYKHMSMFDILVHPTYREGFGKVLQEAMGMRLPIITTDIPGPSEVIEDKISGILVKPKDAEGLVEKMEELYLDGDLRNSLAQNGRERAEKYFDRPIMLNNILEDMNKLLGI